MRKFHSIAALCGDGLRPELQALSDRLAVNHIQNCSSGLTVCSSLGLTPSQKRWSQFRPRQGEWPSLEWRVA